MTLSRAQKHVFDKYNVPRDLQDWVAREFNDEGKPLIPGSPDFLMVISDHLQAAETYLESQRGKLNKIQNPKQVAKVSPEEWQTLLTEYEGSVKDAWLRASGYWRIIDEIIEKPETYGVRLTRQHIDYAFQKKNLPLVEMLKWTRPEFFFIPNPPFIIKLWSGLWAGILGLFSGLWGGFVWAKKKSDRQKSSLQRFISWILYGFSGFFTGMMMGAITSARIAYKIGKIIPAVKLGYYAASYNPFVEQKGSRHKQAVNLKVEELLFYLFEQENEKALMTHNLADRFVIRFAKETEVDLILNFIKESAAQEKMLSEVSATELMLKQTLFESSPKAEVLLGFLDDKPVACMIFYHNYYSILATAGIFIETAYIQKPYQGYGLARRMLSFIANIALDRGCKRLEWSVSSRNTMVKEYYPRMGARPLKGWTTYQVEDEDIQKLAQRLR